MDTKTVFITGANRGLGFEMARALGKQGFYVLLGVRNMTNGYAAFDILRAEGISGAVIAIDVRDSNSITQAVIATQTHTSRLDVLINNAAINYHETTNILEATEAVIMDTVQTNALGVLFVTQAFLPLLGEGSRVINMSATAGLTEKGISTIAPIYSMTKSMVNVITRQLARGFRGRKIIVNACCPGWAQTDMGGAKAPKTTEAAIDTPVWLATDAPPDINGRFVSDRTVKNNW
jgi:NAD(P)-dependent dehydrogenase (short-subunit alcohol dehydrogenase family)